jgi:hypothetical protein
MIAYTDPDGTTYEDKPVPREPKALMCKHCKTREVIQDGYGEFVHADDYKYQCNPGEKDSTFAEVRHGR